MNADIATLLDEGRHRRHPERERSRPVARGDRKVNADEMGSGYSHIVIGAGAIGSATAYALADAGADRVLVIEQFDLIHGFGSSGDHSRIIRHAYQSTDYTGLTPAMFRAWETIENRSGCKLYTRTGGLDLAQTGTPGEDVLYSYKAALDARSHPYENLTVDEIRARYPQWRLDDDVVGIFQQDGGLLDIRRAVSTMTSLALSAGVTFLPRTTVTGIDVRDRGVSVSTSAGAFDADNLVVAVGSWIQDLTADLGLDLPITLSQEQVTYVATPQLNAFRPEDFPVWLYHGEAYGDFYGFPVYGEAAIKIGRDMRAHFIERDQRRFDPDAEEAAYLVEFLRRHLPDGVGPVLMSRTCVYDLTPDRDFILDTLPGSPHVAVFVGAGHAGKFAALVGSILADLVTAGATEHEISPFQITRAALTDRGFHPVWA
ncbi:N-methyl-L-tryptophan oxidase [Microbacterium elymi]|uniref:N-methyl-L-tryptophan oxidase n=1 Tax=Microbacterium elymi TaxID=2909587 RepID=A0ABY5NM31_9MICO|nr:N-methyl-L-tryptophan oxidase [Microbacterium elymi]UUT36232.1 N-methyl-L-tryptophan oxidase [Microbacterium elymi]